MHRPTDKELECTIARMLQIGVLLAAILVFIGGVLLLRHPSLQNPNYTKFIPVAAPLRSFRGILVEACHLNPGAIVQFGLLILIATPVARVLFCVVGFIRQRSRLYTVVSSIVLVILLYSLTSGTR